jgi:hypothetical protein
MSFTPSPFPDLVSGSSNGSNGGLSTNINYVVYDPTAQINAALSAAATATAAANAVASSKGVAGGVAGLDGGAKVPASQLPSYVDDVLEFATLSAFPTTGETGKIYVTTATNKTYRWSGSTYIEISASPGSTDAVTEGSTNLYFTAARAIAAVGGTLASYATQAWVTAQGYATSSAVSSAISALVTGVSSVAGKTGAVTLAKADVGLGSVDNTSDANKPVSSATQTALGGKANSSHTHAISDVTNLQTALDNAVSNVTKIPRNDRFVATSFNGNGQLLTGDYKLGTSVVATWTLTYAGTNDTAGLPQLSLAVLRAPNSSVLTTWTITYDGGGKFAAAVQS